MRKRQQAAGASAQRARPGIFWIDDADSRYGPLEPQPPLRGRVAADVCILGGGMVGLWTALSLKQIDPDLRVVLLEAGICGHGASGRNGGFLHSWWPSVGALAGRIGEQAAVELAEESTASIAEVQRFCREHRVEVDFSTGGWLWTSTSPSQDGSWQPVLRLAHEHGAQPFQPLSGEECQRRLGSPTPRGGVFEAASATVQPSLLTRGLRRVALERGVRIHERSRAAGIDYELGEVRTGDGVVRAGAIALALGAWSASIPALRRLILPVASDILATEPMPEALQASGWTGGEGTSNSRLTVDYYRTTRDGRVVFGRGGGAFASYGRITKRLTFSPRRALAVAAALRRLVPAAQDTAITHTWGGAVDRSADGAPVLGRLPGKALIVYAAGFSGNGVGPSLLAARTLAARALGLDQGWAGSALWESRPPRWPPEPLRTLGGRPARRALQRKEDREEDGQPVTALTRLAAIPAYESQLWT